MTSRGNQSVTPPDHISQPRHVNAISPPPQPYYQGAPGPLSHSQSPYEYPGQQFFQFQTYPCQVYGSPVNDIRGQNNNGGRSGPPQQSLPQAGGYYQTPAQNVRPQQMQQAPSASQQYYMGSQNGGPIGQPRPQQQQQQQMFYFQQANNVYPMPTAMYGAHSTMPFYQPSSYMQNPNYQPAIMNGIHWRNQGLPQASPMFPQPPQKRKSNPLPIINPVTGHNIIEDVRSEKSQSTNAETEFLESTQQTEKEIRQTFTRMVAESLKSDEAGTPGNPVDSPAAFVENLGSPGPQQYQQALPQLSSSAGPGLIMHSSMHGPPPVSQQVLQSRTGLNQQPSVSTSLDMQQGFNPGLPHPTMTPRPGMNQQPPVSFTPPHEMQHVLPSAVPHQGMPHQQGLNQQPPVSITPPHEMQQVLKVNVSVPPPQLPVRQGQQIFYQQPLRPQMPPPMPQWQPSNQILQNQPSLNQTPPPFSQTPPSNITPTLAPQPIKLDPVPEKQRPHEDTFSPNNIPSKVVGPPVTQTSPSEKEVSQGPQEDLISDGKPQSTPASLEAAADEEKITEKFDDNSKEDNSHGVSRAIKDGRKNKKNLKDLKRRDIAGSDMDAFKIDDAVCEDSDSFPSKTNNALETSPDAAANDVLVLESSVTHAASVEEPDTRHSTAARKASDGSDIMNSQNGTLTRELSRGASLDKDEPQEHQRTASATSQVESKHAQKQRKKKKKGHHSPPSQKSKHSTTASNISEKQNETVEGEKRRSSSVSDVKDSAVPQDKCAVPQDTSAVPQDTSAVPQDKCAVPQDTSAVPQDTSAVPQDTSVVPQDSSTVPQDNSSILQNNSFALKDNSAVPDVTSLTNANEEKDTQQSETVETILPDHGDIPLPKGDKPIQAAIATPPPVIPDITQKTSERTSEQVAQPVDASSHLPAQKNKPQENDDQKYASTERAQTDDSLQITQAVLGESAQVYKEESDGLRETDKESSTKAPQSDKMESTSKNGGKMKIQYDRSYLIQLRECPSSQEKPEGLPDLEIILELPLVNTNHGSSPDFTPAFFQTGPGQRSSNSRSRLRPDQMPQRVIKSVSLQDSVKLLHQSEKPWKPTPKQLSAGEIAEKRKTLESDVLFIMNRLTPTNFERLAAEMRNLPIKTYEDLQALVNIFFDKVTIETKFVEAYALLCKVMSNLKVPPPPNSDIKENQATFRVVMLTKCQQEFEADKTTIFEDPEEKRKKIEAEMPEGPERAALIDNTLYQMKMRRLKFYGNIRFIGELFKLGMLTENIMHDCIFRLLMAKDDDSLLSLCNLITTVGRALDTEKAKPRMDHYFAQMAKIAEERKSRIKFTLKDVIDLRNNNWIPRKEQTGPKKIDEVHKDYQHEQATKQFMQSQPLQPRTETPQSNNRRGPRQRQEEKQQPIDDGWNTVGSRSQKIDVSKMRLSKNVVDENSIQLGPCGGLKQYNTWSRGSFGGTQLSQDQDRAPGNNRFLALRGEDDRRNLQRSPTRGDGGVTSRGVRQQGPFAGLGRGKVLARSSQEGDRRDALAYTRSAVEERSPDSSRDNSWNRDNIRQPEVSRDSRDHPVAQGGGSVRASNDLLHPPSVAPSPSVAAAPIVGYGEGLVIKKLRPLTKVEMEQKARTILEEYLSAVDLEEAKLCLAELEGQSFLHVLVSTSINEVLEKTNKERDLTGSFFHEMVKNGLLPLGVYFKGLADVLGYAEDMVIDIPKMWTYMAQIIVPMLIGGSVTWTMLSEVLKSHLDRSCCSRLIAEILLIAKEKTSEQKVAEMWQSSYMDWADFLEPNEKMQFLKEKQLEFTVEPHGARTQSQGVGDQNVLNLLREEIEEIVRKKGSHSEIYNCIDTYTTSSHIPYKYLVRAVVTAIISASISPTTKKFMDDVLKSHKEVLVYYIQGKSDLELEALYAIQALMHSLEHPPSVISSIFFMLSEEDIVSEETFKYWEKSTDPLEAEGKGPCLMQLTQFFAWLRENEELEES